MPNKAGNKKVKTLLWYTLSPSQTVTTTLPPNTFIYVKSTTYVIRVSVELSFHIWRQTCSFCQVKDEEWGFHPGSGRVFMSILHSKLNLPDFSTDKEHTKTIYCILFTSLILIVYSEPTVILPRHPKTLHSHLLPNLLEKSLCSSSLLYIIFPPDIHFIMQEQLGGGDLLSLSAHPWRYPSRRCMPRVTSSSKMAGLFDHMSSSKLYSAHQLNQYLPE